MKKLMDLKKGDDVLLAGNREDMDSGKFVIRRISEVRRKTLYLDNGSMIRSRFFSRKTGMEKGGYRLGVVAAPSESTMTLHYIKRSKDMLERMRAEDCKEISMERAKDLYESLISLKTGEKK